MKQTTKLIGCLVTLLCLTVPAQAKGPAGVAKTVHNLSSTNPYGAYVSNVDEICVFCHTPHGGSLDGPLWNHALPTTTFTHYNSATLSLSGLAYTDNRIVNAESLLCMACHDGSVALSHLINAPKTTDGQPVSIAGFYGLGGDEIVDVPGIVGARIGGSLDTPEGSGDLSDDHPISFSYDDVVEQPIYQGGSRDGELRAVTEATTWEGEGVRFFGNTNRVECSSCHDPHVDYDALLNPGNPAANALYTPFLIMPNTGSALCLACHNK